MSGIVVTSTYLPRLSTPPYGILPVQDPRSVVVNAAGTYTRVHVCRRGSCARVHPRRRRAVIKPSLTGYIRVSPLGPIASGEAELGQIGSRCLRAKSERAERRKVGHSSVVG